MFGFEFFKRKPKGSISGDVLQTDIASVQPRVVYGHIYSAVCRNNSKGYIGQTTQDPKERWQQHRQDATARKQANGHTKRFHFALHEHGPNTFDFRVIDVASSPKELNEKERYWVSYYKYHDPACGYNSTSGGGSQERQSPCVSDVRSQEVPEESLRPPIDWAGPATEPQKHTLRKMYRANELEYCICSQSHSKGQLCRICKRRTDLSVRHAGSLISEFLIRRGHGYHTATRDDREDRGSNPRP
jgi:GIY-YIG catalytic domain